MTFELSTMDLERSMSTKNDDVAVRKPQIRPNDAAAELKKSIRHIESEKLDSKTKARQKRQGRENESRGKAQESMSGRLEYGL